MGLSFVRSLGLLASFCACCCAAAAQTLVVGRADTESPQSDASEVVVRELFERAGLTLQLRPLPLLRSAEMANDGAIDANLSRIADVTQMYPHLRALPTPVNRVDVAIYAASPTFGSTPRADLARLRYSTLRGLFVLDKYSRDLTTLPVQTTLAALELARDGRVDAALLVYVDAEFTLAANGLRGRLHRWPHAWASEPLYFMLHERHAALVEPLDRILRQMQAEGQIERLRDATLRRHGIAPLAAEPGR